MLDSDKELLHESIHAEYRHALAEAQWNLSVSNARNKVKDKIIAEQEQTIADLTAQLERQSAPVS